MERTKVVKKTHAGAVSAILTSDIHLHETNPVCRTDKFAEETQWRKIDWLSDLQIKYDCPVLHGGDLFDYWKPSPELLSKAIKHLPNQFYTVAGNHDLPQHSIELFSKSGLCTLVEAGTATLLDNGHWKMPIARNEMLSEMFGRRVAVQHVMTYQGASPFPGCTAPTGAKLLRKNVHIDLLLTGDNHKPFVEYNADQVLVNPGSLFRTTASQIDFKPRVYLWYAESNTVEPVFVPIEANAVSREHLEIEEQRNERLDAFISTLDTDYVVGRSFEQNLISFFDMNKTPDEIMKITLKAIDR